MKKSNFYLIFIFGLIFGGTVAVAGKYESSSAIRTIQEARAATIKTKGTLLSNSGQMQIRETGTGRIYKLNMNRDILSLYTSGIREVALEGSLSASGDNTIEVTQASALH